MSPSRPASRHSSHSGPLAHSAIPNGPDETSPLINRNDGPDLNDQHSNRSSASSMLRSIQDGQQQKDGPRLRRWPSILALALLCLAAVLIMVFVFIAPHVVQEYATHAMVLEPTRLSIDSLTTSGVIARVQAEFRMDASRVQKKSVRDLGRFGTWIVKEVESKETRVEVTLPRYGDTVIGTADIPPLRVNVRNGHVTPIDFLTELHPGSTEGLRRVADDWLKGNLGQLWVSGKAEVDLHSGHFSLPTQSLSRSFLFEGHDIPSAPQYNITNLSFSEVQLPHGQQGLSATVGLRVANDYPLDFEVPPLDFAILVPNCAPSDPYIMLADATTPSIHVMPKEDLSLNVMGFIRRLPDALIAACPDSHQSPLDALLGDYVHGASTTVYVRGSDSPSRGTPEWITDLISQITVPVPFPGHAFGHLIRKFTLANVQFSLPDYDAKPGSPEAQPRISAKIKALIALPKEMTFPIDVHRVRADADVFYRGKKLGVLNLQRWQEATSTSTEPFEGGEPGLEVESDIDQAPLRITDDEVFGEVVQGLLTSRRVLNLTVKADVDVELQTALGMFVVRQIPAQGVVPVKPISSGGSFQSFLPKIGALQIVDTARSSVNLAVTMNFTNPTNYSAIVPYVNVHILVNGTVLGHATARNVTVVPDRNTNVPISAVWQPLAASGKTGVAVGRELLSQYVSGYNTTLTLKTHNGTIPSQPGLGKALDSLEFTLPTPRLGGDIPDDNDGDDDDEGDEEGDGAHFIKDATMHLFTSTAVFTLLSPLLHSTIYITHLNATAFHDASAVGRILYDGSLAVPPGESTTPRLPVEWSIDSLGYQAIRRALGGTLKLSAEADVGLSVGRFVERIWFKGRGIGAKVRI